jgi:8-oxo-dGTP pyrophosphatase MutT (NUDIX family)
MPDIRADGIAVYVYRKTPSHNPGLGRDRKTEPVASARARRRAAPARYEFLQLFRSKKAEGYQHSWQTVYGGVKKKETAIEAALRELKEETNLTPIRMFQVEFLETFYFKPEDYVLVMPVFAAEVSPAAKIKLNREHTAHRWIPEKQIPQAFMWRTQKEALTHVLSLLHHGSPAMHFLEIPIE